MTEKEKGAQEIPQKRSRFYVRGSLLIAITAIIISLFTGGIAYSVQDLVGGEASEGILVGVDEVREFWITAQQWYYNPKIIKVDPGDTVRFIVTSADITHGFAINELGINLTLLEGEMVEHEIVVPPDIAEGTYTIYCSVFCGIGHPYFKGRIIVGTPTTLLGTGMGQILPSIATAVMAGMFATFIIIGRRRAK